MPIGWLAAIGVGVALLAAGILLIAYEKLWRNRYRGPYLPLDIQTQALLDDTAVQPKPTLRPRATPAIRQRANQSNRPARIQFPAFSLSKKAQLATFGALLLLAMSLLAAGLLTTRAQSYPQAPEGAVVIGVTQFRGAPANSIIADQFADYIIKSGAADGITNLIVRRSQKQPTSVNEAVKERERLHADLLWSGEVGHEGMTLTLLLSPSFSVSQPHWRSFLTPDLSLLQFPANAEIRLPVDMGTDPLVPLTVAIAQIKNGRCESADHDAKGARASLEAVGIQSEIAVFVEATAAICKGNYVAGMEGFNRLDAQNMLTGAGLLNRAVARLYSGDTVAARADTDRILADRDIEDHLRAGAYLLRARAQAQQGELSGALTDFTESVRLEPDRVQARIDKAEVLYRLSQANEASTELATVLNKAPDAAPAHRLLGLVDLMLAQPEEALKPLERAADIYTSWIAILRADEARGQSTSDINATRDATDGIILLNRELAGVRLYEGMALSDIGKKEPPETFLGAVWRQLRGEQTTYERATDKIKEAGRLDPKRGDVPLQLGNIYARMGDIAKATSSLEEASALDPSAPDPYYALARLKESIGKSGEAAAVLDNLISHVPRAYHAYEELSRIYAQSGEAASSRVALERALQVVPQSPEDHLWRGKFLISLGSLDQATTELKAATNDSQLWEAHLRLGDLFAQTGHGPEALAEYKQVLDLQPNNPSALLGAGQQMVLAGQVSEAEKLFSRLTALAPGDVDGHIAYLQLLLSKGDKAGALEQGKQAVKAADKRADTHFYLAQAWEAGGYWSNASAEYEVAVQRDPTLFEAFIRLAHTLMQEDKYVESTEVSKSAIALRPDDPQPYRWKGEAELALGNVDGALASVGAALAKNPTYAEALSIGERAFAAQGRYAEALDFAQRTMQAEPQNPAGHLALGDAYLAAGRYDDADQAYQVVLQVRPHSPEALTDRGKAQEGLGKHEDALKLYADAVESDANYADAHLFAGHVYFQTGRWEQAFREYHRAVEIRPRWPSALFSLGRAYLQKKDLQNAHAAFAKATEYAPIYVEAWFYLGLSERERSQPAQAATAFKRATELNNGYSAAWLYLGLTYEETGNRQEAVKALTQARDTASDASTREQAEQGLERVK